MNQSNNNRESFIYKGNEKSRENSVNNENYLEQLSIILYCGFLIGVSFFGFEIKNLTVRLMFFLIIILGLCSTTGILLLSEIKKQKGD